MRDPGHAAGNQTYRPPPADCVCGHWAAVHNHTTRGRRQCTAYAYGAGCSCKKYTPQLAPADGAAEHRPPPAGASKNAPP
jgi:hypothetical protein